MSFPKNTGLISSSLFHLGSYAPLPARRSPRQDLGLTHRLIGFYSEFADPIHTHESVHVDQSLGVRLSNWVILYLLKSKARLFTVAVLSKASSLVIRQRRNVKSHRQFLVIKGRSVPVSHSARGGYWLRQYGGRGPPPARAYSTRQTPTEPSGRVRTANLASVLDDFLY